MIKIKSIIFSTKTKTLHFCMLIGEIFKINCDIVKDCVIIFGFGMYKMLVVSYVYNLYTCINYARV